jgi:hypothetical protein
MDRDCPKTRQEKKGRDKERGKNIYSQKHVRAAEELMAKRAAANSAAKAGGKKK